MILRRFYLTENKNGVSSFFFSGACRPSSVTDHVVYVVAPTPRSKANRVLKTAIPPVNMKSLPGSAEELEILVQGTKAQSVQGDVFAALEGQGHTTVTGATPEAGSSTDSQK